MIELNELTFVKALCVMRAIKVLAINNNNNNYFKNYSFCINNYELPIKD